MDSSSDPSYLSPSPDPDLPDLSEGDTSHIDTQLFAPEVAGYKVHELLGRGGMGAVWRATELASQREVALKVLAVNTLGSRKAIQRFEREIELASRLEHPGIARVYQSGVGTGAYFFAMELIEGVPLGAYMRDRQPSLGSTLQITIEVLYALGHAHRKGVIHRDLKPGNILVDPQGHPQLLDFGLATAVDRQELQTVTADGVPIGTLAYMSPEQARGQVDRVDMRSDLYAMGVVLFECLLGQLPYSDTDTRLGLENCVVEHRLRRPRSVAAEAGRKIHRDLEAILEKSLAESPERRYNSADSFAQDLQAFIDSEPVSAVPLTAGYVLRRRLRKRWRLVSVVAAVLAVFIGGAVWSYIQIQQQRDRAVQNEEIANRERVKAEEALYLSQIAHAQGLLTNQKRREALDALEQCDPAYRGAEWGYLRHRTDSSLWTYESDAKITAVHLDSQDRLKVADADGELVVLSVASGTEISRQRTPVRDAVHGVLSDDGQRLLSWNTEEWGTLSLNAADAYTPFVDNLSYSRSLVFGHEDHAVVMAGRPPEAKPHAVYDMRDGSIIQEIDATHAPAKIGRCGPWLYLVEYATGNVTFLDEQYRAAHVWRLNEASISDVVSQDDRLVAGLDRGRVAIASLSDLDQVRTLQLCPDRSPITALATTQDTLAAGCSRGHIHLTTLDDRRSALDLYGLEGSINWVRIVDNRWLLAATYGQIKRWDLHRTTWPIQQRIAYDSPALNTLALMDEGRTLGTASGHGRINSVASIDLQTLEVNWSADLEESAPRQITPSPDESLIFVDGNERWMVVDARQGEVIAEEPFDTPVAVRPVAEDLAIIAPHHGRSAVLFDLAKGRALHEPVPIRWPLVTWKRDRDGAIRLLGACADDDRKLVSWTGPDQIVPTPVARFEDAISALLPVDDQHALVNAGQASYLIDMESGKTRPLAFRAIRIWASKGRGRLLCHSENGYQLLDQTTLKPILGLKLPNLFDAVWLEQQQAWLVTTNAGLRLIPTTGRVKPFGTLSNAP